MEIIKDLIYVIMCLIGMYILSVPIYFKGYKKGVRNGMALMETEQVKKALEREKND